MFLFYYFLIFGIYGSRDGGNTIQNSNTDLEEKLITAAKVSKCFPLKLFILIAMQILNLKGHLCGFPPESKLLYSPVDLEGHKGKVIDKN